MSRIGKIILYTLLGLVLVAGGLMAGFVYKIKNGFPVSYETDKPVINFPPNQSAVLLFSKTTGYRHDEAIAASKLVFADLAKRHNWFLYETEEGGVFNTEQLARFKTVIFNNSTGRVLTDEQQQALENYMEKGGTLIGIHSAGDDSHHWDWYEANLLGTKFSHHPLDPQLQKADVTLHSSVDSTLTNQLPQQWTNTDEWYVFFGNPKNKGFTTIYSINGDQINSSGNLFWIRDKAFGMGQDHPVAWYKVIGRGKTFYTSMGHTKETWARPEFVKLLENALVWANGH